MLGIGRPRLRARPSLFELITKKDIEDLSILKSKRSFPELVDDIDDLPPLPLSPDKFPLSPSLQLTPPDLQQDLPELIKDHSSTSSNTSSDSTPTAVMAPSKSVRGGLEEGETGGGAIFSVSGPVIVAENMTGCAMYELVCGIDARTSLSLPSGSVKLAMINWSAR